MLDKRERVHMQKSGIFLEIAKFGHFKKSHEKDDGILRKGNPHF